MQLRWGHPSPHVCISNRKCWSDNISESLELQQVSVKQCRAGQANSRPLLSDKASCCQHSLVLSLLLNTEILQTHTQTLRGKGLETVPQEPFLLWNGLRHALLPECRLLLNDTFTQDNMHRPCFYEIIWMCWGWAGEISTFTLSSNHNINIILVVWNYLLNF